MDWLIKNWRKVIIVIFMIALITSLILLCVFKGNIYGNTPYTIQFWGIIFFSAIVIIIDLVRILFNWPHFGSDEPHNRFLQPIISVIVGTIAVFGIAFSLIYGSVYSYAIGEKDVIGLAVGLQRQGIVLLIFVILFSMNMFASSIIPFFYKYEKEELKITQSLKEYYENLFNRKYVGQILVIILIILSVFLPSIYFYENYSQPSNFIKQTSIYTYSNMEKKSQPICTGPDKNSKNYSTRYITNIFFYSLSLDYIQISLSILNEKTNISKTVFNFTAINWSWSTSSLSVIKLNKTESLWATIYNKPENDSYSNMSFTVFGYDQ